jgi:Ca2+-binding RTX toxin-like protein
MTAHAEPLEPRRLLAGIEAGILVARGTENGDAISLRRSGIDDVIVTTNGVNQTFDMDDFTGVRLEGLGGNDTFNLIDPLTSPVVRNTTVFGGDGEDTVGYAARSAPLDFTGFNDPDSAMPVAYVKMASGEQVDRIALDVEAYRGGSGADRFLIGLPNTSDLTGKLHLTFDGGDGDDLLFAVQFISTTLFGGAGNDNFSVEESSGRTDIFGGDGDDSFGFDGEATAGIDAGNGVDTLQLGVSTRHFGTFDMRNYPGLENVDDVQFFVQTVIGNDLDNRITLKRDGDATGTTVLGLGGNDTLVGANGSDSLVGGYGDDSIVGGDGFDTADGGPGNNVIVHAELTPAAPNIRISNGILMADGSWGQDLITIERTGIDDVIVRVNAASRTFDMDDFNAVLLSGNRGYDDLRVLDPIIAGSRAPSVTLRGGDGNDTFTGSHGGDERLDGGAGNDRFFARGDSGVDTIFGGNGTDTATVDNTDITTSIEFFA